MENARQGFKLSNVVNGRNAEYYLLFGRLMYKDQWSCAWFSVLDCKVAEPSFAHPFLFSMMPRHSGASSGTYLDLSALLPGNKNLLQI